MPAARIALLTVVAALTLAPAAHAQSAPTSVNSAIVDSVTIANTKVLAEAPAMAMGSLYQTIGNSVAMAAANAVYAQQQANVGYQAASTMAVAKLEDGDADGCGTYLTAALLSACIAAS